MFRAGFTGECTVHETMRNVYMLAEDESSAKEDKMTTTPLMKKPLAQTDRSILGSGHGRLRLR